MKCGINTTWSLINFHVLIHEVIWYYESFKHPFVKVDYQQTTNIIKCLRTTTVERIYYSQWEHDHIPCLSLSLCLKLDVLGEQNVKKRFKLT